MRTFIAIEFTTAIHQQLHEIVTKVQSILRAQHAPAALRWVAPDKLHLTLRFLGDTTPAQAKLVATSLRVAVATQQSFGLTIGGIGGFPTLRQPRVLWLAVGGELPQLHALQRAVEASVQLAGFPAEARPFSAHVTLARAQRRASPAQLRTVGHLLQPQMVDAQIGLQVREIVHMESELQPSGPIYRPIAAFPLAQADA